MDKKKGSIFAWTAVGIAIIGVIILLAAAIFAIMHLEVIFNECSNAQGVKSTFNIAIAIASSAVGLQIVAIVVAVVGHFTSKKNRANLQLEE